MATNTTIYIASFSISAIVIGLYLATSKPSDYYETEQEIDFSAAGMKSKPITHPTHAADFGDHVLLPNAIGIGAEKCGTGALRNFMSQHHQVDGAKLKPAREGEPIHISWISGNIPRIIAYYRREFTKNSGKLVRYQHQNDYLSENKDLPYRMKAFNFSATYFLLVCDPVARAWSDWVHIHSAMVDRFQTKNGNRTTEKEAVQQLRAEFTQYLQDHPEFTTGAANFKERTIMSRTVLDGFYAHHLKKWLTYFPSDRFIVLDGERFRLEPWTELTRLTQKLGLEKIFRKDQFTQNKLGFWCFQKCFNFFKSKGRTRGWNSSVTPTDTITTMLKTIYKEPNEQFFKLLGHNFGWNS